MTESTLTRDNHPRTTNPSHASQEQATRPLVFHSSSGGGVRQLLITAGAVLLSIMINLALLAFIGYLDTGRRNQPESPDQQVQATVQLQTPQDVEARKKMGSSSERPEQSSSEKTPENQPPPPEPVTNPQPLHLTRVSNQFDLDTPQYNIQHLAPSVRSTSSKRSDEASDGSESDEQGDAVQRGKLDQLPRKTAGPDPSYPPEARRNRTEGWVLLELDISRSGAVTSVSVLDWNGHPAFKQSALEAVRRWRFKPGKVDGTPVDARNLRQRIRFQLLD